jgi:hypothetical protein
LFDKASNFMKIAEHGHARRPATHALGAQPDDRAAVEFDLQSILGPTGFAQETSRRWAFGTDRSGYIGQRMFRCAAPRTRRRQRLGLATSRIATRYSQPSAIGKYVMLLHQTWLGRSVETPDG